MSVRGAMPPQIRVPHFHSQVRVPFYQSRARKLGATAAISAAGFGAVAWASATRASATADRRVRGRAALPKTHPVRRATAAVAPLGKWWAYMPIALGIGAWLLVSRDFRRGERDVTTLRPRRRPRIAERLPAAVTVVGAGALAAALSPVFDKVLPQPPVPPGRRNRRKPVFPSGHAFGPTALAATSAWVLAREGLLPPSAAIPVSLAFPLTTVAEKLAGQKHWASDVVGGWLAGAAIAAGCLAAYESTRED